MSLYSKPPAAQIFADCQPLQLEFGATLPQFDIAYETWGELSPHRDNAILICPAFSAHSHARSQPEDPRPGWWEEMVGPGLAIDTRRFFVICPSLLGGCYGTTGPPSINPETGRPYLADFPEITMKDIVDVHMRLINHLEIDKLYATVGGSMGGMQTLEIAVEYPSRVNRVVTISATQKTQAFTSMIRHIGRRAIMIDPEFRGGFYDYPGPVEGLKLAREIGTIFYRSREEFNERFSTDCLDTLEHPRLDAISFDFQSYLSYQAKKILLVFDANSYLRLSFAMDLHDIGRGRLDQRDALSRVQADLFVMGVREDRLIPIDEQRALHEELVYLGKNSQWHEISSGVGHDAFLVESELLTPLIQQFFV